MTTRRRSQKTWLTPLDIPEAKVGEYAVEHIHYPANTPVIMNNSRNFFLGNQKAPQSVVYDIPTRWHKLIGPTGTWMTDLPVEQRQMEQCIKGMRGRVLVGGLGLGLAATMLVRKRSVKRIVICEISDEVLQLVWNHLPEFGRKVICAHSDLFAYLKEYKGPPFDYALFDIWQSDSETTFHDMVVPLYELSKGKVKHPPVMWNIDVMRGQLFWSLQSRLLFLKPEAQDHLPHAKEMLERRPLWEVQNDKYHDWAVPFWQWWREAKPSEELAQRLAGDYARIYGKWNWQRTWLMTAQAATNWSKVPETDWS